jgi:hypothetical protein
MSDGELEADYVEQVKLSDRQRSFVDHYMTNGFDKLKAFFAAGYKGSRADGVRRVALLFAKPVVQDELARRRAQNTAELRRFTPLDVMGANLDFWFNRALDKTLTEAEQWAARIRAQEVAVAAAPYVHPRLQAIQHMHQIKRSIDDFSDDELQVVAFQSRIDQSSGDGDGPPSIDPEGTGPQ